MTDKVTCEIFLAINESGDFRVSYDEEQAVQDLVENDGGYNVRVVKITAKVTPPQSIEVELDVPDEAGETKEVETEAA